MRVRLSRRGDSNGIWCNYDSIDRLLVGTTNTSNDAGWKLQQSSRKLDEGESLYSTRYFLLACSNQCFFFLTLFLSCVCYLQFQYFPKPDDLFGSPCWGSTGLLGLRRTCRFAVPPLRGSFSVSIKSSENTFLETILKSHQMMLAGVFVDRNLVAHSAFHLYRTFRGSPAHFLSKRKYLFIFCRKKCFVWIFRWGWAAEAPPGRSRNLRVVDPAVQRRVLSQIVEFIFRIIHFSGALRKSKSRSRSRRKSRSKSRKRSRSKSRRRSRFALDVLWNSKPKVVIYIFIH